MEVLVKDNTPHMKQGPVLGIGGVEVKEVGVLSACFCRGAWLAHLSLTPGPALMLPGQPFNTQKS